MHYPTELAVAASTLDLGVDLGPRGSAAVATLTDLGLRAVVGLDASLLAGLASAAGEDHIVEYCPNDRSRFGDLGAATKWAAKGRGFVAILGPADTGDSLLAYGWSGIERNDHVAGADITTAYRVTRAGQDVARALRAERGTPFRLGLVLGELVIASAVRLFDGAPDEVSLETWRSNATARHLYELLGFVQLPDAPDVPATRPTLEPLGSHVHGASVRVDDASGGRIVDDARCFYVLRGYAN